MKSISVIYPSGEIDSFTVGQDDVQDIFYSKQDGELFVKIKKSSKLILFRGLPFSYSVEFDAQKNIEE